MTKEIHYHKGLPLIRPMPKWCCPYCGETVGYMGNWLATIFGTRFHGCDFRNVRTDANVRRFLRRSPY